MREESERSNVQRLADDLRRVDWMRDYRAAQKEGRGEEFWEADVRRRFGDLAITREAPDRRPRQRGRTGRGA